MKMIKGKYEFANGVKAKVYRDDLDEVMVNFSIPSYVGDIILPLDELDEFVDNVYNSFDEV